MTLLRNIRSLFFCLASLSFVQAVNAADPMDDVFTLLDTEGGVISNKNKLDGYYVVAMGMANHKSELKGYESARLDALKQLNEVINGISISGSDFASQTYGKKTENGIDEEYLKEQFISVVKTRFNGHLSAAKTIKKGQYDGQYFVAIQISESDINQINKLTSPQTQSLASSNTDYSVASFSNANTSVESKGLASLKLGEQKAREQALQDALRNAVQQAQGVMLQGKSGRFNEALSLAMSTKTEGYVSSYEIVDEDIQRGNYYVIILGEVNGSKLLNDANFYLEVLGKPSFAVTSNNLDKVDWLTDELERLGFTLSNTEQASHTFYLSQKQKEVTNHKNKSGIETSVSVKLQDNNTGEILFTVTNNPHKTKIYVSPVERAKQVSQRQAFKQLKKKLGKEVIQSLANYAKKGRSFQIVIKNAKRNDIELFKHVLNNGTEGTVSTWDWQAQDKTMTLNYVFTGTLSEAMDQGLAEIYQSFKTQGKGRRPHLKETNSTTATFEMVN